MKVLDHVAGEIVREGIRVDIYISERLGIFSRSQLKSRVTRIILNGKEAKPSKKIYTGDALILHYTDQKPLDLEPEKMDLKIIFENEDLLILDKEQGVVVHPGSGNPSGTLLNGIIWHCAELVKNFPQDPLRPGIVHRLDKETSGVIIVAKNPGAHEYLASQFRKRRVKKKYIAIVKGSPPMQEGLIETFIDRDPHNRKRFTCTKTRGKKAVTEYRLLRSYGRYSLVGLMPRTGRTHQLRVHMKHINCPILGDDIYGRQDKSFPQARLFLHAYSISIRIPFDKLRAKFRSRLPERFKAAIREIRLLEKSKT